MRFETTALLIAFLLVVPLGAYAGTNGGHGPDLDLDGVEDLTDNCPPGVNHPLGVTNPSQAGTDGDGRGDLCDNCLNIQNGPNTYAAGLAAVSQCDKDSDGYGNACDGDLDGNGFVTPLDNPFFLTQLMSFFPGPSGWACKGGAAAVGTCPPLP